MTGSARNRILVLFDFGPRRLNGDAALIRIRRNKTKTTELIPTEFCSTKTPANTHRGLHVRGEVCCLRLLC